jgi:hypothetical protein
MHTKASLEILKIWKHLEELGRNGRIILKYDMSAWISFNWLRTERLLRISPLIFEFTAGNLLTDRLTVPGYPFPGSAS